MTRDEREELVPVKRGEVSDLTTAVTELARRFRWQVRLTVGLVLALVMVVVALGLGATALVGLRHQNQCIAGLAAASADRTGVLAPLSAARTDALVAEVHAQAQLITDAFATRGLSPSQRLTRLAPDQSAFEASSKTYDDADAAYQRAYTENPPPAVPDFHC